MTFFGKVGEIKYVRMAGDENAPIRAAYIEFTDQRCVAPSLGYNNQMFAAKPMRSVQIIRKKECFIIVVVCIDIYQFMWPRKHGNFGARNNAIFPFFGG